MATYTPNLNLVKPTYSDNADVTTLNGNMDILDTAIGGATMGTTATTLTGAVAELNTNKAPKANPVITGSISMERKYGTTVGGNSATFGDNNTASGSESFATGKTTKALGNGSFTAGYNNEAGGRYATAEGFNTKATGYQCHAQGEGTIAAAENSSASGLNTLAGGKGQNVFGMYNVGEGPVSWPEWVANTTYQVGDKVKRTTTNASSGATEYKGYTCNTGNSDAEFTAGHWTAYIPGNYQADCDYVEIVGNGNNYYRSNARALDWNGNERLKGDLYVNCNANSSGGSKVVSAADIATTTETQEIISAYDA